MHLKEKYHLIIISCLLVCSCASCISTGKLSKQHYLNGYDDKRPYTSVYKPEHSKQCIYLIRHAKPDVEKQLIYASSMAQDYVIEYNQAPIIPFDPSLVKVDINDHQLIYSSPLRRAHETAQAIFPDHTIETDSLYREFETRIVQDGNIYAMPLIVWQSLSRLMWVMGLNQKEIESYAQARNRAMLVADRLADYSQTDELVILVAHGMLNRSVTKALKKQGWIIKQKHGHHNIGATVLVKEE